MSSMQLNPWQAQLWEQAIPIFVSIGDLTENHSGAQRPGVTADRLLIAIRRSRIAASYPRQCIIPQLWMEASPCAPKTPWLRVVGRRGQGSGKATIPVVSVLLHRQYWGPPRSESALPWCLSSQLASTHAKRTARGQSGLYGLSHINQAHAKPEKKGTSNPAQPGIVTRKGYTSSDFQSPKVTGLVRGNTNVTYLPGHLLPSSGQTWHAFLSEYQSSQEQCHPAGWMPGCSVCFHFFTRTSSSHGAEGKPQQLRPASSSTGGLLAMGQPGIEAGVVSNAQTWGLRNTLGIDLSGPRGALWNSSG